MDTQRSGPERQAHERRARQRLRCLVIDDDDVSRRALVAQLHTLGLEAGAAATAREGLALVGRQAPGVVLLDACLPDACGYALAQRICQWPAHPVPTGGNRPGPRLVAVSARADAEHYRRCRQAGFDCSIGKPVALPVLARAIGLPAHPSWDAGGPSAAAALTALYQQASRGDLLALQNAVRLQDDAGMRRYAHRIRGAAQIVGAHAVAGIAAVLERAGDGGRAADPALRLRALHWLDRLLAGPRPPAPGKACHG